MNPKLISPTKNLATIIEPLLMVIVAGGVLFFALAVNHTNL